MVCATERGIVGILHDEMTGSGEERSVTLSSIITPCPAMRLTCVIATDCCLHKSLHPFANGARLIRAEEVGALVIVNQTETILSRVDILVDDDLISNNVDVPLDLRFL